jgi:putative flavoprotein involved in K+ transport
MKAEPFPGKGLELKQLQRQGMGVVGRVAQAEGKRVSFADGKTADVDAVLWATGYRDYTDWVEIPEAKDAHGNFLHHRGVSPVQDLYFIGRSWQWSGGSALFAGLGEDAAYVTEHIVKHLDKGVAA